MTPVDIRRSWIYTKVVSLDWSSKDLNAIEKYLAMIDHLQVLTKTQFATASVTTRYITDRRQQTPTPQIRVQQDTYFSHKMSAPKYSLKKSKYLLKQHTFLPR